MEFRESPEEAAFRAETRAWLQANAEPRALDEGFRLFAERHDDAYLARAKAWQAKKADAGWAGITWPRDCGGRGGSPMQQIIWDQEVARFDAPEDAFAAGIRQGGPTVIAHGTVAQKRRYLPPLLRGDEIWCQLFSEPDAGSDLAGVTTTLERHGDDWVANGQKIWTSGAHCADVGFLLARSNWDVPKHRGLTFVLLNMHAPGVTVRPLRQITGGANFNEVFLDDVRVPAEDVVGSVHEGWRVALTTLAHERSVGGLGGPSVGRVIDLARTAYLHGRLASEDPLVRQDLAQLYMWSEALRFLRLRVLTGIAQGRAPGVEGSVGKLAAARLLTRTADLAMRVLGPAALLDGSDARDAGAWQHLLLAAPAVRIAGGTDEVQRNLIAEQALGLPREPRPDKDVPFRETVAKR